MGRNVLPLAGIAVLVVGLGGCARSTDEAAPSNEYALAETRNLEITAEASGQIEAIRVVDVKSKASGEVLKTYVETGDHVERGTLLAEIDPRDVRNAYEQAKADKEVADARLKTSEAQRQRSEELRKANVIAEQELETARLDEANSRSQLVKANTNLQLAEERLGDVTLRAPITGTIITKGVEAGVVIASASQNVSGGTTLFQMADLTQMQVRALVDETDLGRVEAGQTANVSVEAYPDRTFHGSVEKIEPQAVVEQNVTMFPVLVLLDNSEGLLKPGMNADVQIEIARRENVLAIPNAAVVSPRDAVPAGMVLGMTEDEVSSAMGRRGGSGAGMAGGGRSGRRGSGNGTRQPGMRSRGNRTGGQNANRAVPADDSQTATQATTQAAAPAASKACTDLMAKAQKDGFSTLTEAERTQLRGCRTQVAGAGAAMAGNATDSAGEAAWTGGRVRPSAETRAGVVFVKGTNGPALRNVTLGLNDWDYTEVLNGLQPGDSVVLISVARLQQKQEEFLQRVRQRSSGPFPGGGGPGHGPH